MIVLKLYHPLFYHFVLAMICCTLYHVVSCVGHMIMSNNVDDADIQGEITNVCPYKHVN